MRVPFAEGKEELLIVIARFVARFNIEKTELAVCAARFKLRIAMVWV